MAYSSSPPPTSQKNHSKLLRNLISLLFVTYVYTSLFVLASLQAQALQLQKESSPPRRIIKALEKEAQVPDKKAIPSVKKNQTKPIKPIKAYSSANSTTAKSANAGKKSLQLLKAPKSSAHNSTAAGEGPKLSKTQPSKVNQTKTPKSKFVTSSSAKESPDLVKSKHSYKNRTTATAKPPQHKKGHQLLQQITKEKKKTETGGKAKTPKLIQHSSSKNDPADDDEGAADDLVAELRELPSRFQEAIVPDLEKISTASKAYISMANREIAQGFKPLVGSKYASLISALTSCIFLVLPLLLVSLLFNQLVRAYAYVSLQKILFFIQVYLGIYFLLLSLAYFATGVEPLRFFYATSRSTYVTTQVVQTVGYVVYLVAQAVNLVAAVVFPYRKEKGSGAAVGVAQVAVGLSVGLHYYAAVFHRAMAGKPPKTDWRIHGLYAASFLVICFFAGMAERRKRVYLQSDGREDDGQTS